MSQTYNKIKENNPYDTFKVDKKIIYRNKSQIRQYDKTSKKIISKKLFLNKILNRTKSILKSKSDFSEYMKDYNSMVTKLTFKSPDIQSYPLLRKSCSDMISLKNQSRTQSSIVKKKIVRNIFQNEIMNSTFKDKFRATLNMNIYSKIHKNKKLEEWLKKKKERDKLFLYEDFFYKWKKKEEDNKDNSKYSDLCYDENKIFYSDYSELIKEKIHFCKNNKLENLQKKLKIIFEDKKKKKIKLELISMKLIFEPIKEDKNKYEKEDDKYNFEDYKEIYSSHQNNTINDDYYYNNDTSEKNNIITFPLSYVFLFYINGIDYFKNILIGSIKFSNDFKNVYFQENEIYSIIRNNKKFNRKSREIFNLKKMQKKNTQFFKKGVTTRVSSSSSSLNQKQFLSLKSFNYEKEKEKEKEKKTEENMENIDNSESIENMLYITNKKIKIIHSNYDLRNKQIKKKDINYSEYSFIWETPNKSYKVRIIMPLIIFWSEHIQKNVITFCDKELFLFLLKNNFINWDYYILYYLFSLKLFRLIILKGLSFYSKYNIKNHGIDILYMKHPLTYINENTMLLNINRKIYNQYNDNQESYKFFYTDNFSINSIIDFHSFHIFIENDKLNKNICYEFCLNFKQMFYLINISYYENLEKFLPKIIQINFEERKINIDFSVLEYFSNKILGKINTQRIYEKKFEKKDVMVSNKSNRAKSTSNKRYEWDNMIIDIKMPFIIKEQFVKSNVLNNNVKKFDLNTYFLNILKKSGNNLWSKKILQLLDLKDDNPFNNSNLDLVKIKSKDYSNEQNYDDFLKKYNNIKRHSKSLHFKIRKSNI